MPAHALNDTILRLSHHYEKPKDLLKAVRKKHPDASKTDIVHALLETMIQAAQSDETLAARLHELAMDNRGGD